MKIYAVEHDLEHLLLVDGRRVINGDYDLIFHKNGSAGNHVTDIKAYFVMEAFPSWFKGKWDYNSVLMKAEAAIKRLGLTSKKVEESKQELHLSPELRIK